MDSTKVIDTETLLSYIQQWSQQYEDWLDNFDDSTTSIQARKIIEAHHRDKEKLIRILNGELKVEDELYLNPHPEDKSTPMEKWQAIWNKIFEDNQR